MFRAYDAERERLVAVKLFKLDLPPERVHQLVAEFETLIAADLTHPAIAKPLATGLSGIAAYLAHEYVAAESLDLAVREYGPAPPADALRVAAQLAGALDFAAVVNIHHGAVHPRDVLLSSDDTRLTGVGVAQALERVGVVTPVRRPYTAPERIGHAPLDRRADVFGLAAVIFELLCGRRVAGTGEQAAEPMADVAGADLDALRPIFAKALAENPADRYETTLAFADALRSAFPRLLQPSVVSSQFSVNSRQSKKRPKTEDSGLKTGDRRPMTELPFDVPEASDRADVEIAPLAPPVEPAPQSFDVEEVFRNDLPLAAAEQQRYEDMGVAPAIVEDTKKDATTEDTADTEEPKYKGFSGFSSVSSVVDNSASSRSAVWPLALALGVGIAIGYAGGYSVGSRDKTAPAAATVAAPAGREFTETAVKPESPAAATAGSAAASAAPSVAPRVAPSVAPKSALRNPQPAIPSGPGRLLVRSTPAGAHVTIDGRDAGLTPVAVRDLTRGSHHVRITRDGYASRERRIVITRGRPSQSLIVPLARERATAARTTPTPTPTPVTPATIGRFAGALQVDSRPAGAKIFLDGKLIGTTPLAMSSVGAGEHAIRLERDGYRRWSSSVRVVANEQNRVTASLER